MKAKVIIAQATAETAEALYGLVKKMVDTTAIKAYPSVDYQAVFFSADRYDLDFVKRVLADKCFSFKIEDAGKSHTNLTHLASILDPVRLK